MTHAYPIVEIVKVLNSLMDLAGITPTELGRAFGVRPYRGANGAADGAAWRAGDGFRRGRAITLERILTVCRLTEIELRLTGEAVRVYRKGELFRVVALDHAKSATSETDHDSEIMGSSDEKSAVVSSG